MINPQLVILRLPHAGIDKVNRVFSFTAALEGSGSRLSRWPK